MISIYLPNFLPALIRLGFLWLISVVVLAQASSLQPAGSLSQNTQQIDFNFPKQSLAKSLLQLSEHGAVAIFAPASLLEGKQAKALLGTMTVEQALAHLLQGSGLRFVPGHEGFVVLREKKPLSHSLGDLKISPPDESYEELVITTTRAAADRLAIKVKQQSMHVMDALASTESAELPDINVADAYRRIVGLNTLNDSDEGRFVSVRGIDPNLNFVSIDGMAIATDEEQSRDINLESMPVSAVGLLKVYKTHTAELDGNRIGGNMEMSTLSARDFVSSNGEGFYLADLSLSKYSLDEVPDSDDGIGHDIHLSYSNIFGSDQRFGGDHQFGVVASGIYSKKIRDEQKWDPRFRYITADNGERQAFRERFNTAQYSNVWVRKGGSIKLEYFGDQTENLYAYLHGYYYFRTENEDRDILSIDNQAGDEVSVSSLGGETSAARAEALYNQRPTDRKISGTHFHLSHHIDSDSTLSVDFSFSRGFYRRPNREVQWNTAATDTAYEALSYRYSHHADYPQWELANPVFAEDTSNYLFEGFRHELSMVDDRISEFKLDYLFNAGQRAQGLGVKTGIRARKNKRQSDQQQQTFFWSGEQPITLDGFVDANEFIPEHFNNRVFFLNEEKFFNFYDDHRDLFTTDTIDNHIASHIDDALYEEQVYAAYTAAHYRDTRWHFVAGLRYEYTDFDYEGFSFNASRALIFPSSSGNHYDNLLPSMHFRYQLSDQLRLQAAWSNTLGRPGPKEVKASSTVEERDRQITIDRKNPALKPRLSNNYDLSLEYVEGLDTLISLALFHKDINGLITGTRDVRYDAVTDITTTIESNHNGGRAHITGLEISIVKNQLGFLPGPLSQFGFSANASRFEAQMTYVNRDGHRISFDHLDYQPEFIANLSVFYPFAGGRGEARAGYHYTGRHSDKLPIDRELYEEDFWEPIAQVDMQVRYDLNDQFSIKAQVRNLNNRSWRRTTGGDQKLLEHEVVFGRSVWLGLRFNY